jgi:nitroreductase
MKTKMHFLKHYISTDARQTLRSIIYTPQRFIDLLINYFYDIKFYLRHSSTLQFFNSEKQLNSWIDADAHKLEKGLALPEPRSGFGEGVATRLVREIDIFINRFGASRSVDTAIMMLSVYQKFNLDHGVCYTHLFADIDRLKKQVNANEELAGCDIISKRDWLASAEHDLTDFFRSRRSIRDFSASPVLKVDIEKAIMMAINTPTVCNRQAVKAHIFSTPATVSAVLNCQSGNGGFGNRVKTVAVMTVDRQCFFTAGERNQCWIDGGLFSMSFIYALHSLGLGSCCLNWSATKRQDQKLRQVIAIEDSEAVIMMVAIGHLKNTFKVAKSARKPAEEFLTFENIKKP